MALNNPTLPAPPSGALPEGAELESQLARRNRSARIWLALFQLALMVAIVALIALLFKIVNDSMGLVAVENALDPDQLLTSVQETRMLALPNTTASEEDAAIAAGVASSPYAVGFFGYAQAQEQQETLRAVSVDGVAPSAASVESGSYPLARPLYLYAGRRTLEQQPEAAAFVAQALGNADDVAAAVGFFPATQETLDAGVAALLTLTEAAPVVPAEGTLRVAGSSTMAPLMQRLLADFAEQGFAGTTHLESMGTQAGFNHLCSAQDVEIAAASRAQSRQEAAFCRELGVRPVEFRIGSDAVVLVVSAQNDFLEDVTQAQLQAIFTGAERWSEVNAAWPDAPIERFIPGADSGTLDFMAGRFAPALEEMTQDEMIAAIAGAVSPGVLRRLEREEPLAERSQDELLALLEERVIQPSVVASWNMMPSLLRRGAIEQEVVQKHPDAHLQWRYWLTLDFLTAPQSSVPEQAGVRTAILGSLLVILITMIVAVPIGIGTAVYLEEYAGRSRLQQIIQTNIDNLAGVPSIIYGILGLTVFVRLLEPVTSGTLFGAVADPTTANGRTVLAAALTLALLVLPMVIINAQEAIRAVPSSLREAGYGLGGTKWQVTWTHVLGNALPGIFTGTILSMSRALGETAPLIVIGASTFITQDPSGPFSKFTVLPMQIYQWTSRPQPEFRHIAAAASVVLLILLLLLNGTAIYLRNRYSKKL